MFCVRETARHDLSLDRTSRTFLDQVYVMSQVRRRLAGQRREDNAGQFEVDTSVDWKPVQLAQHW